MVARFAVFAAFLAALVVVGPAGAAIPHESARADAQFDLWTGVWVEERAIPERRLVLRQLPSGELQGIFWNTSGQPPDPETLDPEFFDLVGYADPDGDAVAQAAISIPGGTDLVELDLYPGLYPWQLEVRKPGVAGSSTLYRYERGGDNRAVLDFGRSWAPSPVRRGERVRLGFELRGLGPRAVTGNVATLTVIVPRVVGTARIEKVSAPESSLCVRAKTKSSWVLRCLYRAIVGRTRVVHVDVSVPTSFRAKYLNVHYEVGLAKGWRNRSGLEEILSRGADPEATLKIRVLPATSGGGSGGGGAGGGGQVTTRTFTSPTGTVTVPASGLTATGRILYPQAIILPQAAADEYCKRVDANGHYTMTGTSSYRKATAFKSEAGGSELAVGLLLWEFVLDPLEVFERITCSA